MNQRIALAFIVATVTCQPDEPSEDNADTPSATDATTLREAASSWWTGARTS